MIRGISFKITPNNNILHQILNGIDVKSFYWHIIRSQSEVWANSQGGTGLERRSYSGKDFFRQIINEHFIIFLKLQAYCKNGCFHEIHTYEDFQKGDCQLLLLIYDCNFVEIYVKSQIIAETIYEDAHKNGYTEVEYITDINDGRNRMDII